MGSEPPYRVSPHVSNRISLPATARPREQNIIVPYSNIPPGTVQPQPGDPSVLRVFAVPCYALTRERLLLLILFTSSLSCSEASWNAPSLAFAFPGLSKTSLLLGIVECEPGEM